MNDLTPVSSYTGSASPYGTFDQGGNVGEWNESIMSSSNREVRGGSWVTDSSYVASSTRNSVPSANGYADLGFRLAMIPEPSTGLLLIAGLLGLAMRRRASA